MSAVILNQLTLFIGSGFVTRNIPVNVLISSKLDEGKKGNWNLNLDCTNNLWIPNCHDFTKLKLLDNIDFIFKCEAKLKLSPYMGSGSVITLSYYWLFSWDFNLILLRMHFHIPKLLHKCHIYQKNALMPCQPCRYHRTNKPISVRAGSHQRIPHHQDLRTLGLLVLSVESSGNWRDDITARTNNHSRVNMTGGSKMSK